MDSKTVLGRVASSVTQKGGASHVASPKALKFDEVLAAAYLIAKWQVRLQNLRTQFFVGSVKTQIESYDPLFGDEDSDGKIERDVWTKAFRFFDLDGGGTVTVDEMESKMINAGCAVVKESMESFLTDADFDHSKSVDLSEFLQYAATKMKKDKIIEAAKDVFEAFDTDGNGSISVTEIVDAMQEFGEPVTTAEADQLMKELDANSDGQIQINEFYQLVGLSPPVKLKLSSSKGASFYMRAAKNFLQGAADGRPAACRVTLSALGNAIPLAAELAGRLEAEGIGIIVAVQTFQREMGKVNAAGIEFVMKTKA